MDERLKRLGITGGVWAVPAVKQQPVIHLERWRVFELSTGERHLVGWNRDAAEGRVSSTVTVFDAEDRQAVTRSGRVYRLCGEPGHSVDGLYVWDQWLDARGAQASDVTNEIARLIDAASQD
ncbi:MAG TPA: hypothetical protein VFR90_17275 [Methylibium sp.]|uniref:hypothetical protein n=1 Tax=Methylibium sp. TaxID=2067992 RepID=UPI002DC004F6|nr:hypothetical protein [Methylibium sp.]HEU4460876.1 hypothetical protein [Methylibium sp.]